MLKVGNSLVSPILCQAKDKDSEIICAHIHFALRGRVCLIIFYDQAMYAIRTVGTEPQTIMLVILHIVYLLQCVESIVLGNLCELAVQFRASYMYIACLEVGQQCRYVDIHVCGCI